MKVEVRDGKLVIEIEIEKTPRQSASGKTLVVASTRGFRATGAQVDGKQLSISINATTPVS